MMTLTDDSRSTLAEIEADARATYDPRWDGVDEATAMEWEREAANDQAVAEDDAPAIDTFDSIPF